MGAFYKRILVNNLEVIAIENSETHNKYSIPENYNLLKFDSVAVTAVS